MFKEYFEVRDYEIDVQGVVNNANYMNYFAHTRHKYLDSIGVNFTEMAKQNQMLYLIKSEIEYKQALVANDKFYVTCEAKIEGVRIIFEQEIRHAETDKLVTVSKNTGVCMNKNTNRPYIPQLIKDIIAS